VGDLCLSLDDLLEMKAFCLKNTKLYPCNVYYRGCKNQCRGVYTPALFITGAAMKITGAARIIAAAALTIAGGAMKIAGEFTDWIKSCRNERRIDK
jgi:hypothetical protein